LGILKLRRRKQIKIRKINEFTNKRKNTNDVSLLVTFYAIPPQSKKERKQ